MGITKMKTNFENYETEITYTEATLKFTEIDSVYFQTQTTEYGKERKIFIHTTDGKCLFICLEKSKRKTLSNCEYYDMGYTGKDVTHIFDDLLTKTELLD